ncbi:MAG: Maf family protein, partial [Burkholderiaceae bacterium]|nr:Maf family protein [Burkholderiaceae bacterium]
MSSHAPTRSIRPLVLASTSAYRRELLQRLRVDFTTQAPDVDETPLPHEAASQVARR